MIKENLYNWYISDEINNEEKNKLTELGISVDNSSSDTYALGDLKKLIWYSDMLKQEVNIPGTIQKLIFFSTWWNNNCVIVVYGEGSYHVKLLIRENTSENLKEFAISPGNNQHSLNSIKERVENIEEVLESEHPILCNGSVNLKIFYNNNYSSNDFPSKFENGEVKRIYYKDGDLSATKDNPDAYFKPLDIVKIFKRRENKNKDIHPDLTKELKKQWEDKGFTYEQTKEWANALGEIFKVDDCDFCAWLRDTKQLTAEAVLNDGNLEELIKKYNSENPEENWGNIHRDFGNWFGGVKKNNQQHWEKRGFTYQETQEWIKAGFKPGDYEFITYLRSKGYQPNQDLNLERLREEFKTWKKSPPAQEYLDWKYPQEKRNTIKRLDISGNLIGTLDLSDFRNLEGLNCSNNQLTELKVNHLTSLTELDCRNNQLTRLDLTNCNQLKKLKCRNNYLQDLKLPSQSSEQLTHLSMVNNNLSKRDLSMFSDLVNLEELKIGNDDQGRINQNIYNQFYGSLKSLKDMSKLNCLKIDNTDIDSGLEYLPESVKQFYCSADERKDAKVKNIYSLFVNEKGKVEIDNIYGYIKNFPQKFQDYKQKKFQADYPLFREKAEEQLSSLCRQLDEKSNELSQINDKLSETERDYKELEERYETKSIDAENLKQQLKQKEIELEQVRYDEQKKSNELNNNLKKTEEKFDSLNQEIEVLNTTIKSNDEKYQELKAENESLKKMKDSQSKEEPLAGEIIGCHSGIESKKNEINDLESKIIAKEEEIEKAPENSSLLEKLKKEKDSLKAQLLEKEKKLVELQKKNKELEEQLNLRYQGLQKKIAEKKQELEDKNRKIKVDETWRKQDKRNSVNCS